MRAPTSVHEKHLLPKAAEKRRNKNNGMMLQEDYQILVLQERKIRCVP
jgi:hypothetical protein